MPEPETYLGQILRDGKWLDYARGHREESKRWQEASPDDRRVVDWIDRTVIFPTP